MAIPANGFRQPCIPADCDGNEAALIQDGDIFRLAVDADLDVPGDEPEAFTANEDLGINPLDETTNIATIKEALWLALHLTAPLAADQVFSIYLDSADGAAFDTLILQETLDAGTTDKWFSFPPKTLLRAADQLRIVLTTSGGETAEANLTVMFGV